MSLQLRVCRILVSV
uniref:Uncharacterized protein n=1 Tax=Anguilla anguilla TaxID=7936 RepID=A0A0E9PB79_ANGAN